MEENATNHFRVLGPPLYEDIAVRIDKYLAMRFPFFSRAEWQLRIKKGDVTVNHQTIKATYTPRAGDQVRYFFPFALEPEVNATLKEIWRDDRLLVINKPAPLPMHEGGPYRENTLCAILNKVYPQKPAPLHRLDRETSGLVLCSHDYATRAQITKLFADKKINKTYLAIVKGQAPSSRWQESGAIGDLKDSKIRIKKWVVDGGLPAHTDFRLVAQKKDHALVLAFPKTGRTNQIRIHLGFAGLPILGDKLYHPDENVFLEYFEKGTTDNVVLKTGFPRHCLHAIRLNFIDPGTKRTLRFFAPVPQDMAKVWRSLP